MGFRYDLLFTLAKSKGMNKTQLREAAGISTATLAKLSKNEDIGMDVLGKLCTCLNCQPGDILTFEMERFNPLLHVLKERISDAKRHKLEALNVVSADENAYWLIDYWCGKDVRGLLQMPFSRHWIMHVEACLRIKDKLLTKK